jgi:hypothetical protein
MLFREAAVSVMNQELVLEKLVMIPVNNFWKPKWFASPVQFYRQSSLANTISRSINHFRLLLSNRWLLKSATSYSRTHIQSMVRANDCYVFNSWKEFRKYQ